MPNREEAVGWPHIPEAAVAAADAEVAPNVQWIIEHEPGEDHGGGIERVDRLDGAYYMLRAAYPALRSQIERELIDAMKPSPVEESFYVREALTAALPIEIERERKRWEGELTELLKSRATELEEWRERTLRENKAGESFARGKAEGLLLGIQTLRALNTIFGPEEEGEAPETSQEPCERCGGSRWLSEPAPGHLIAASTRHGYACPDCQGESND